MRARRDELSSHQSAAVVSNLTEMGANYVPLLASWCAQLLPEIAEDEEVRSLKMVVLVIVLVEVTVVIMACVCRLC